MADAALPSTPLHSAVGVARLQEAKESASSPPQTPSPGSLPPLAAVAAPLDVNERPTKQQKPQQDGGSLRRVNRRLVRHSEALRTLALRSKELEKALPTTQRDATVEMAQTVTRAMEEATAAVHAVDVAKVEAQERSAQLQLMDGVNSLLEECQAVSALAEDADRKTDALECEVARFEQATKHSVMHSVSIWIRWALNGTKSPRLIVAFIGILGIVVLQRLL